MGVWGLGASVSLMDSAFRRRFQWERRLFILLLTRPCLAVHLPFLLASMRVGFPVPLLCTVVQGVDVIQSGYNIALWVVYLYSTV